MLKVLFFTPTSALTGSEIVLYNIVNNINPVRINPLAWISKLDGELTEELGDNIKSVTVGKQLKSIPFFLFLLLSLCLSKKSLSALKKNVFKAFLAYVDKSYNADIWYINTILQQDVLEYAYLNQIPCVVHAHELEQMLVNLTDQEIEILVNYPKLIISCSKTSAKMLATLGKIENIETCFPSINIEKISQTQFNPILLREKLNIAESTFIWCMSGSIDSNKNPIKFIEIANQLLKQNYDCHFLWLGNNPNSGLSIFSQKYSESLGIDNKITWTGILRNNDYYEYLNLANGFVLTSSRESFSIVSLEALYLKKPVVSFNCGGIREIVNDKLGCIVDSWNTNDMVEAMIKVMNDNSWFDPDLARKTAEFYAIENQVKEWEKIMLSYF